MPARTLFLAMAIAALPAGGKAQAPAQAQAQSGACVIKSRSETLVVMVCPPRADAVAWRSAGQAACAARNICNVWIWDDATKAPPLAPRTDAGLSRANSGAAVAIWVNDSASLVLLRRAAPAR
ncbi:hypothetical protein C8P66_107113 [Humitalea rosea]|uniref:Uncharacterized protein n=1 Tax=Humitalea rosea TaxID=990373 RepID=A0A2W7IML2_9PROT|nr:hypothetical protein [Humitalea rosea]PZW47075.1 hypothetical protein C8P66_107113 [Humitalea rosea]